MTAPAQVIAVSPPAPPTATPAAPAPPTIVAAPPVAPLIIINGATVPAIPQTTAAGYGGLGTLSALAAPAIAVSATATGYGLLTWIAAVAQPTPAGYSGTGQLTVQAAVGPGGAAVTTAAFAGAGQLAAADVSFTGLGSLAARVTPNSGDWPSFYGTGTATAVVSMLAGFGGLGSAVITYTQSVYLAETVSGVGGLSALVAVGGHAVVGAGFGAIGAPTGVAGVAAPITTSGNGIGAFRAAIGPATPWSGTGALSAAVGVVAGFGATLTSAAPVVFPAWYKAGGVLTATAVVTEVASFSGTGALIGPNTSGVVSGFGVLTMSTGGSAPFGGIGSATAGTGGPVGWSSIGALVMTVSTGFRPAAMIKNGTGSTSSAWTQLTGWTADTTDDPGSTVSGNALVSQGGKTGSTVSTSVAWTPGMYSNSIAVRLKQNGAVIATGTASTTSPSAASASVTVAQGDLITVEILDSGIWANAGPATIATGSGTWVHIT